MRHIKKHTIIIFAFIIQSILTIRTNAQQEKGQLSTNLHHGFSTLSTETEKELKKWTTIVSKQSRFSSYTILNALRNVGYKNTKHATIMCLTPTPREILEKKEQIKEKDIVFLTQYDGHTHILGCPTYTHRSDALITYDEQQRTFQSAKWLEDLYGFILRCVDYGFVLARPFSEPVPKWEIEKNKKDKEEHEAFFRENDFQYAYLEGKKGYYNEAADTPAGIVYNPNKGIIIVTFHGAIGRIEKPLNEIMDLIHFTRRKLKHEHIDIQKYLAEKQKRLADGDWATSIDMGKESARQLGLKHYGWNIQVHKGFGKDIASCQTSLLSTIDDIINKNPNITFRIIVTGHSKGGGMANVAAPIIHGEFPKHRTYLMTFGSPRSFPNNESAAWAIATLGLENTIAVFVDEDTVPQLPPGSYQMLGIPVRDKTRLVYERAVKHNILMPNGVKKLIQRAAINHYGDPEALIYHKDLTPALHEIPTLIESGLGHLLGKDHNPQKEAYKQYLELKETTTD